MIEVLGVSSAISHPSQSIYQPTSQPVLLSLLLLRGSNHPHLSGRGEFPLDTQFTFPNLAPGSRMMGHPMAKNLLLR
jgi:hypothetical protein